MIEQRQKLSSQDLYIIIRLGQKQRRDDVPDLEKRRLGELILRDLEILEGYPESTQQGRTIDEGLKSRWRRPPSFSIVEYDREDRRQLPDPAAGLHIVHIETGQVVQHPKRHEPGYGRLELQQDIDVYFGISQWHFLEQIAFCLFEVICYIGLV